MSDTSEEPIESRMIYRCQPPYWPLLRASDCLPSSAVYELNAVTSPASSEALGEEYVYGYI
jgi:hypothetical protein